MANCLRETTQGKLPKAHCGLRETTHGKL